MTLTSMARLVHAADWGYLSSLDPPTQAPSAQVASYSDGPTGASSGRLFFYLMAGDGIPASFAGALTMSEAVTEPAGYRGTAVCGDRADVDPQVDEGHSAPSFAVSLQDSHINTNRMRRADSAALVGP